MSELHPKKRLQLHLKIKHIVVPLSHNLSLPMSTYLRLGLCCLNTQLRKQRPPIFSSRTCSRRTFPIELAMERALTNCRDLLLMIEWNHQHRIECFRLSSQIFPHYTDPMTARYSMEFAIPILAQVGQLISQLGHRVLMHPGQFDQIGAIRPSVWDQTVADLSMHAEILDAVGMNDDGIIIVHGGGVYGSKQETITRWIEHFHQLPRSVQRRLAIENCERQYSVSDCLEIAQACHIPMVLDFHHYTCWNQLHTLEQQPPLEHLIPSILSTWKNRRIIMHLSQQSPGKRVGAHDELVDQIPTIVYEIIRRYHCPIDLEIEAKGKEQAILYLYQNEKLLSF